MRGYQTALKAFLDVDRVLTNVRECLFGNELQLIGADHPYPREGINPTLGTIDQQYHIAQAVCEINSFGL